MPPVDLRERRLPCPSVSVWEILQNSISTALEVIAGLDRLGPWAMAPCMLIELTVPFFLKKTGLFCFL